MLDDLRLVRDVGGLLRVPTDDELERVRAAREARDEEREGDQRTRDEAKIARIADQLLVALDQAKAPISSQAQLKALVSGARGEIRAAAVARLVASGRIVVATDGSRRYVRG